jgi:hypothetical protein
VSSLTLETLIESFVSKLKVRQILTESIEFIGEDARLFVEVSLLCVEFNSEVEGGEGFNLKKEEIDFCFFCAIFINFTTLKNE